MELYNAFEAMRELARFGLNFIEVGVAALILFLIVSPLLLAAVVILSPLLLAAAVVLLAAWAAGRIRQAYRNRQKR